MTLEEHPDDKLNTKWRLLTIRHEGVQPQAWSEDSQGNTIADSGIVAPGLNGTQLSGLAFGTTRSQSPNLLSQAFNRRLNLAIQSGDSNPDVSSATLYANAFTVQSSTLAYRPPQSVKPLIDGPQIAIVVGPEGEEIFTDEYGRVKVHFPWDRHKDPKAEDSSCWIRVSSNWAGACYAHIAIPRIGHEVIVDFLEGDPDQPIITGRTYHAKNMPPYELPANKTRMTIKSQTHKGEGHNELRFEDEKDREEVFIYAQKDMNEKIENNASKRVNVNQVESIGLNKAVEVTNNEYQVVGGDLSILVGPSNKGSYVTPSADKDTQGIGVVAAALGKKGEAPSGQGTVNIGIEKSQMEAIGEHCTQIVEKNKTTNVKKNYFIDVEQEVVLTAGKRITFQCGDSLMIFSSDGIIELQGKKNTIRFTNVISLLSDIVKVN